MESSIVIQKNVSLAPLTTFKIGGKAEFFVDVADEGELKEALFFASEKNLNYFFLGGGSNILFSDEGFSGLVIRLRNRQCEVRGENIICGAGASLGKIVNLALERSLSGLEWAVGIPGTVGGAVRGNAGAFGSSMEDVVCDLRVLDVEKKEIFNYVKSDCRFAYRNSVFKENNQLVVVSANFCLKKDSRVLMKKLMRENLERRAASQPMGFSAGSFFENPEVENEKLIALCEKETGRHSQGRKIPAGWLIEEMGFRGKKIGQVMVSEKHANFILNLGGGTAHDVIILAGIIKQRARREFGVRLREEVSYVGF